MEILPTPKFCCFPFILPGFSLSLVNTTSQGNLEYIKLRYCFVMNFMVLYVLAQTCIAESSAQTLDVWVFSSAGKGGFPFPLCVQS